MHIQNLNIIGLVYVIVNQKIKLVRVRYILGCKKTLLVSITVTEAFCYHRDSDPEKKIAHT